jgi:hypothetical protein
MEPGLCVSKERGINHSGSKDHILQVTWGELDQANSKEYCEFLAIYNQAYVDVANQDLLFVEHIDFCGHDVPMFRLEQELFNHTRKGGKVHLCYKESEIIGFMLYHNIYNCVLVVPYLYFYPQYYNKGLGCAMVDSLGLPIKRVVFQTHVAIPPEQFLKSTEKFRRKIHETDKMITWEMDWGRS